MRLALALIISFALCGLASAQQPDKETRKQANAHFKQGKAFFDTKQWDRAIAEYEAAWALIPEPLLQFNIALALEQQGELEAALEHFAKYLELDPGGAVADEAREDVARLTPQVEKLRAEREAAAKVEADRLAAEAAEAERLRLEEERKAAAERQRLADEQAKRDEAERQRKAEADALAARHARAAPTRRRGKIFTLAGYSAIGVGAIAVAVAVGSGLQARSISNDLEGHDGVPWTEPQLNRQADGERAQTRMYISSGVSAAAIVGGAVLVVLGRGAKHRADVLASPGSAGARSAASAVRRTIEHAVLTPGPGHGLGLAWSF